MIAAGTSRLTIPAVIAMMIGAKLSHKLIDECSPVPKDVGTTLSVALDHQEVEHPLFWRLHSVAMIPPIVDNRIVSKSWHRGNRNLLDKDKSCDSIPALVPRHGGTKGIAAICCLRSTLQGLRNLLRVCRR
jgi:hypothetical protein